MQLLARISSVALLVVILVLCGTRASAQQGSVALVEKISGAAFLRNDPNAKPSRLDPKSDTARRLYPGQQVRCEQGGYLSLRVGGRLRNIYGPSGWFTIPRETSTQTDPLRRALDEYGRRGGRDRGGSVPAVVLFSPSDRSVVSPGRFAIHWTPLKPRCTASFIIHDADGKEIWRQDGVRGTAGILNAPGARRALQKHRRQQGDGPLILKLNSPCGTETRSAFSLISDTDERFLNRELVQWNKEPGVLTRHLGRAAVFNRYGMFPQTAHEYEAALAKAPQSRELLLRTIAAQRQVGNSSRAEGLSKRLPVGAELP